MLSALLAIGWQPEIHGVVIIVIAVGTLCGSVYLLLGTNLGARLGLLVSLAGLFGWMATMGFVWWAYGIGLKGKDPTWKPTGAIVVDGNLSPLGIGPAKGLPDKPLDRAAEFVAVDEIQLCADPDRGHVFTDRRGRAESGDDY